MVAAVISRSISDERIVYFGALKKFLDSLENVEFLLWKDKIYNIGYRLFSSLTFLLIAFQITFPKVNCTFFLKNKSPKVSEN